MLKSLFYFPLFYSAVMKIQSLLQKINEEHFYPYSMQLDLLKNNPQHISTVAQWIYDDWFNYDSSLNKEKLIHSFKERLNEETLPISFVIVRGGHPIGVISLKYRSEEFENYPHDSIWMGSLHVALPERKKGLGQTLLKFVQRVVEGRGHQKLYFYTSDPSNVKWYIKNGAELIEERPFRNHFISVMSISLIS
jgi:predicted N-acetyltransferase YhbS